MSWVKKGENQGDDRELFELLEIEKQLINLSVYETPEGKFMIILT